MRNILTVGDNGADTSEDKEQSGDELGEVGHDRPQAQAIIPPSESDSCHFFDLL